MKHLIKKTCFCLILIALLSTACSPLSYLRAKPGAPASTSTPAGHSLQLQPCQLGNIQAQCGSLKVYENRETRTGRLIELKVAVIKAQAANPAPDPIFYLAGGPGASAIEDAPYALKVLNSAVRHRDLVLVDQRGTGGSNLLTCPRSIEEVNYLVPLDEAMVQDLKTCLSQLGGDPAAYTTAWAMDDLDEVRAALGYDQINLYGESYGPMAEQVYLQRHGSHVRTMTLEGSTLLDVPIFERFPRSSQAALDLLLARCQADPTCHSAYPNLRAELGELIARVENQPVNLGLTNPRTGQPVMLNRAMLVQGIHSLLIQTPTAVLLPGLVHGMYQRNFDKAAQLVSRGLAAGADSLMWKIMNLTILCHEDWARMDPAETAAFSQGSYIRYEDVRRYTVPEKICAVMPRPQPSALHQPLTTSPVPVLIIGNQADPQNPPENIAGASEHYPNSLTVIAPGQGHGYLGFSCRDTFISAFIDRGTTGGLDTSCLQKEPLPPFPIDPPTALSTLSLDQTTVKGWVIEDFDAVHRQVSNDDNRYLIFGNIPVSKPSANLPPELSVLLGRWEGYSDNPPVAKDRKLVMVIQQITEQGGKAFVWSGTNIQFPDGVAEIEFRVVQGETPSIEWQIYRPDGTVQVDSFTYDADKGVIRGWSKIPAANYAYGPYTFNRDQSLFVYKDYTRYLAEKHIYPKNYQDSELSSYGKGYLVYLPDGYEANPQKDWPLIFFMHGNGDRGDNVLLLAKASPYLFIREKGTLPFIIVAPLLNASNAYTSFPESYMDGVLAEIQANYRVDAKKIYVTGLSIGGEATYRFALHRPDTFAAAAPLAAYLDLPDLSILKRIKDLPVWAIHGAEDPVFPVSKAQQPVDALRNAGGNIRFTVLEGHDHDVWTDTYLDPAFYKWLLEHHRAD